MGEQNVFSFFQLAVPVGIKVIMAIVCGGLIGIERELKHKPAGIKTNILICLGSALYTIVSILIAQSFSDSGYRGDPSRIAAQIVSGIGFIGAGTIMQSKASVHGLTTAATIWVVAAIGVCIGAGYPFVSFVFTMTVLFTLLAIDKLEDRFIGRDGNHVVEISYEDNEDGTIRSQINQIMSKNEISLDDFDITKSGSHYVLHVQHRATSMKHKRFMLDLWNVKGIKEVKRL
ncbi:MAG: MgtC/SapB family protein [Bacteriovoracia bacterium]